MLFVATVILYTIFHNVLMRMDQLYLGDVVIQLFLNIGKPTEDFHAMHHSFVKFSCPMGDFDITKSTAIPSKVLKKLYNAFSFDQDFPNKWKPGNNALHHKVVFVMCMMAGCGQRTLTSFHNLVVSG